MREISATPEPPKNVPAQFRAMIALIWTIFSFDVLWVLLVGLISGIPPSFYIGAMCVFGLGVWVQLSLGSRRLWARIVTMIMTIVGIVSLIAVGSGDAFSIIAVVAAGILLQLVSSESVRLWCVR